MTALRPLDAFSPGDDYKIWADKAKAYSQLVVLEAYGYGLLSLMDDHAATQLFSTGITVNSSPEELWATPDEIFSVGNPEHPP